MGRVGKFWKYEDTNGEAGEMRPGGHAGQNPPVGREISSVALGQEYKAPNSEETKVAQEVL